MKDMIGAAAILLFALAVIVGVGSCTINGCGPGYSDGQHTGTITKISRKGVFIKSWEGEMLVGSSTAQKGGTLIPDTWSFSVESDDVAHEIEEAAKTGGIVTLHYNEWWHAPVRFDASHIITKVEKN